MDTLCIPVRHGKIIRRKAISQMDFIYAGADNILVIDPALQSISERALSKLELRLQLACSPWMTRCWTYMEARLARSWKVQLQNNLYNPAQDHRREFNQYFRIHTRSTIWTDECELEREAISFYQQLWPLVDSDPNLRIPLLHDPETSDVHDFVRIWRQLARRSTTRRGDRLIILATLLDLNPGEVMSLSVQEQMRAILRTQIEIPLAFLFESFHGPVLDAPKCEWIPLYPESPIGNEYGCMTRNRACTHYQFILSKVMAYGYFIGAGDIERLQFRIDHDLGFSSEAYVFINLRDEAPINRHKETTCIILSQLKRVASHQTALYVGARFRLQEVNEKDNTCTLVYDCPIKYTTARPAPLSSPIDENTENVELDEWPHVEAKALPRHTQIFLDCGRYPQRDHLSSGIDSK